MSNLIQVAVKKDDDGHTFVIPYVLSNLFDEMLDSAYDDDFQEFNSTFASYMIGGSLDSVMLFVSEHYFNPL